MLVSMQKCKRSARYCSVLTYIEIYKTLFKLSVSNSVNIRSAAVELFDSDRQTEERLDTQKNEEINIIISVIFQLGRTGES